MSGAPWDEPAPWQEPPLWDEPPPWQEPQATPPRGEVAPGALSPVALAGVALPEPGHTAGFTRELRAALADRLATTYDEHRRSRPEGPVEVATRAELAFLTSAAETFDAVGRVFTDAAKTARGMAGDVVLEVRPDAAERLDTVGGSVSVNTGRAGAGVRVTVTQPTEAWTDTAALHEVIVDHHSTGFWAEPETEPATSPTAAYERGMRDAFAALARLTSPPKWKTSALDVFLAELDDDLAARLRAAYGRRPKGEPRVTTEEVGR